MSAVSATVRPPDRIDNRLEAGAAAGVPGDLLSDRVLVEAAAEQRLDRHQDPRRAEATLERVLGMERVLQRPPLEPLDGADGAAVDLHREQQARADGDAVELHRAGAADAVLAADVRAGEPAVVADEVREERPRLDLPLVRRAVDLDANP